MKKKILSLLLISVMVLSFTACSKDKTSDVETEMPSEEVVESVETPADEILESEISTDETVESTEESVEIPAVEFKYSVTSVLDEVFKSYEEDFKFPYGAMIGEEYVDGIPMEMDLADVDNVVAMTNYPRELVSDVNEMSVVMHMMNANIFTGVGISFSSEVDIETVKTQLIEAIEDVQWLCGSPEVLTVGTVDKYLVYAYGTEDAVSNFADTLMITSETAFIGDLIPLAGYELAK